MGHWTRPGHESKVRAVLAFSTPKKSEPEPEIAGPDPELITPKFSPASPPVAVSTRTSPDKTLALIGRAIRAGGDLDLYNADLGDEGARTLGPALAKVPKDRSFQAIFLGGNRLCDQPTKVIRFVCCRPAACRAALRWVCAKFFCIRTLEGAGAAGVRQCCSK